MSRTDNLCVREEEKMILILRQILVIMPVFLLKFMMGLGVGWLAPMLHQLKNDPETAFTSEQCAWIAAAHYVSRGCSSFLAVLIIDRLGRNVTLIFAAFISFFIWIAVYCSRMVYVHYAVRLLFGVSVAFNDFAAGIIMAENCSSNVRGIFNGLQIVSFYLGETVEFLLAAYLSYEWVAVINCTLGLLVVLSTFLLREPAHYLIMKGNLKKAEENYDYLHDLRRMKSKLEFEDIKQYVEEMKNCNLFSWKTLRSKEVYRSLRIVMILSFISLAGGFTAVNTFVTIALAGSNDLPTSHLTILFGLAQFLSVSISFIFLDSFNRRTLFLFSSAVVTIIHATTAALYYASSLYEIPHFDWILFTLLTSFSCIFAMFISPLVGTIQGELFPQNIKAMGSSLTVIASSLGGFLGAKIFLQISDSFGVHTNFLMFSIINFISFVYIYFDLPETKGKTLTDIQRELKSCKKSTNEIESIRL